MPGCKEHGEFRAPKDRDLKEYHNLCDVHIKEYNQAWNYFADMSDDDIADHMKESYYGHRPTWKYGANGDYFDDLHRKARETYSYQDERLNSERYHKTSDGFVQESTPETEAVKIMGLTPPLTLEGIKKRYKQLAKTYHPDFNPGNKEAEEKLKEVNMAYTILKMAHQNYEKIMTKHRS
jgi:hypothetical protein